MLAWIKLAIRALRGERTYSAVEGCGCDECLDISKVPFRNRFNQPPFRVADDDR